MAGARSRGFSKRKRLRTQGDFRGMQRRASRFSRGSISLLVGRSPKGSATASRLGMVVSRKVGIAVKRNAIKRWLREWFRTRGEALPTGLDLVVIARPGTAERGHQALVEDMSALLARAIKTLPAASAPAAPRAGR